MRTNIWYYGTRNDPVVGTEYTKTEGVQLCPKRELNNI